MLLFSHQTVYSLLCFHQEAEQHARQFSPVDELVSDTLPALRDSIRVFRPHTWAVCVQKFLENQTHSSPCPYCPIGQEVTPSDKTPRSQWSLGLGISRRLNPIYQVTSAGDFAAHTRSL